MFENHFWHNSPPSWSVIDNGLLVTTAAETDFWNNTHYRFRHTNGHAYLRPVEGDFSAQCAFSASYKTLYDQAGVLLRVDDDNWLKCGIEYTDGIAHFSVVVTRDDQSDWSVIPLPVDAMKETRVQVTRHEDAVRVQYAFGGRKWAMARLAHLRMTAKVSVGPMACSPVGSGLEVRFSTFAVGPAISKDLHD